jgi:hypothetical protein
MEIAGMKFITKKSIANLKPICFCRISLIKGHNRLLKAGFEQLLKKRWFKKGQLCVHYNAAAGLWILDGN